MSAQGGTLKAPVHVPVGLIIAAVVMFALAVSVILTVGRIGDEPVGGTTGVAQIDWSSQLGHPQVRHPGQGKADAESRMPVQRLYPDGFANGASSSETDGFTMPEQRLYPDGFKQPMPEQRVYPNGL